MSGSLRQPRDSRAVLRSAMGEQVVTPDLGLELVSTDGGPQIAYVKGVRCSTGTQIVMVETDELGNEHDVAVTFTQPEEE